MGDPAGIGGELVAKAVEILARKSTPVVIGDAAVLEKAGRIVGRKALAFRPLGRASAGEAELVDLGLIGKVRFGRSDASCGAASYGYLTEALRLLSSGTVDGLVTCPITKKSIQAAGIPFPGHTEILAHYAGITDYVMMMKNRKLKVCLVTIHVPLKDVPGLISAERVLSCIAVTDRALKNDFAIPSPVIKVCGLNPHAGEQGLMGSEEGAIAEAIGKARALGVDARGPFPADSLFHGPWCDAYIAMYHDQGLIPVKALDFKKTVNITLGLPFVRTSVGHGTGLDIAGTGAADPASLIEAYRDAESIVRARARADAGGLHGRRKSGRRSAGIK